MRLSELFDRSDKENLKEVAPLVAAIPYVAGAARAIGGAIVKRVAQGVGNRIVQNKTKPINKPTSKPSTSKKPSKAKKNKSKNRLKSRARFIPFGGGSGAEDKGTDHVNYNQSTASDPLKLDQIKPAEKF